MKKLLTFLTMALLFYGVGWAAEVTDVLDWTFTGASQANTNYSNWSNKKDASDAIYAGNSASQYSTIQLRGNNNSGIISTNSGGKIKKVIVEWNSNTANGRTLDIYGKNTAYANVSDLYSSSNQGTKLGSIVKGTSTELNITGNYTYIGLRSNSGAMYITKISIIWETGGGSTDTYTISGTGQTTGGTISATATSGISSGTSVTLTATPDTGYELTAFTVGGTNVFDDMTGPDANGAYTYDITVTSNVTVEATFTYAGASVIYERVTSESGLKENVNYLMIYESTPAANGALGNNTYLASVTSGVSLNNGVATVTTADVAPFTLRNVGTTSNPVWVIQMGGNSSSLLYVTSDSNAKLSTTDDDTDEKAQWTIAIDESTYDATVANAGVSNKNLLQYNPSSPRFANYSNQSSFCLYKAQEPQKTYDVTVTQPTVGGTISASPSGEKVADAGEEIILSYEAAPGYTFGAWDVKDANDNPVTVADNKFTMPASSVTVTATFLLAWNEITYTVSPDGAGQVWVNPSNNPGFDTSTGTTKTQMGTSVTFKVVPGDEYLINTVSAVDASGAPVALTQGETNGAHNGWGTYYTFEMPAYAVTISATFKQGDMYILGTVNDNEWDGNAGVPMTFDSDANTYTADVYVAGTSTATGETLGYGRFSFTTRLSGTNGSWANMGKRFGATSQNYSLDGQTGNWTDGNQSDPNAFRLPAGVYTISINWGTGVVSATPKTITVTLNPVGGQQEQGTVVNVSSNLTSLLSAIKEGVTATLTISDGTTTTSEGYTLNNNVTLTGKASYGYIEKTTEAAYTVVKHYAVTCTANPTAGGTVSASPTSALANETVTLTITTNKGYQLSDVTLNGTTLDAVEGVYSFSMPAADANVVANFSKIDYTITIDATKCTISAPETANYNQPVTFTVTPSSNSYEVSTVTVTYGENGTKPVTNNGDGTYTFYMPDDNVTITVVCTKKSTGGNQFTLVTAQNQIVAGGEYVILDVNGIAAMAKNSNSTPNYEDPSSQFNLSDDVVTLTDGSNVSIIKLANGSTTGTFTMQDGTTYIAKPTSRTLQTSATTPGDWTITYGSQGVTFNCNNYNIRYNAGHFRCYTNNTGDGVKLYKRIDLGTTVSIQPDGGDVIGSQNVVVDASTETAVVRYKVGENGTWSEWATGPVNFTLTGDVDDTKTVYAEAKEPNQELEPGEEEEVSEANATFHFIAPNAPVITPSSKSIMDVKQSVTITTEYADGQVEYSTDGGETWTTYNGVFDVFINALGESATVTARVTVNGVTSETTSATYTRNIQPVVFSPVSGTYYYGEQSVEMFSVTPGARIYYTMTTDGTEPADPVMNGTGVQLYSGPIEGLEAGTTYKFKAVAYIGTTASEVSSAEYTIEAHSDSYWQNVAAMNADDGSVTKYFENPVQVVYMSTYQNNGRTPEFCYVRDNSGYGLVYFAKNHTAYNGYTKFQMGDWLDGKTIRGTTDTWDRGFHNELGTSSGSIYQWPSNNVGNTTILPEAVTNADVKAGWNASNYNSSGGYKTGVTDDNLWGHYIHLRNNTVSGLSTVDDKYKGVMTDQNNEKLTYYDVFYQFSGFGTNAKTYNQSFFDARQSKGATFDFYGIVAFYGPDANDATYANQPFQIVPLDILWVYKPQISGVQEGETYVEPQEVTLSIDAVEGDDEHSSVIWYKTSEMDDYAIYTGPFTVSTTTTIEAYTTKMTEYSDRMESVHVTTNVNFTHISTPFIKPDGGVYAVTDDPVDVTITRNPELDDASVVQSDVNIWFTVDGSDPADENNPNRYEYTTENKEEHLDEIHTTTTVRAISEYLGVYSEEAISQTYTFVESNGIIYNLVTNVNQINENGVYVIVNQPGHEAMSNVQGATTRGTTGVKFVDEDMKTKVYGNQDVAVFTVTPLTHEGDTGGEKHFLFTTHNGATLASNGILYVDETAAANGNTLLTEAEEDAMGNSVAVVTIDNDEGEQSHKARIRFNYAGGDNRYLQYWNRDHYFTTYKTQDDERAVYLYYKEATPLATIEKEGVKNQQYTVADRLLVVAANNAEHVIWAKDEGNVSIARTEIKNGQIDYMRFVAEHDISTAQDAGVLFQKGDWDQSNWVMIKLLESDENYNSPSKYKGSYILPASLTGRYTDDLNYTIEAMTSLKDIVDATGGDFTPNVYCAANFLDANLNLTAESQGAPELPDGDRHFFFVNPKVQEVATITYAVWDGTKFVMPARNDAGTINGAGLTGAFNVGWTYNGSTPTLETGVAYQFTAVLNKVAQQGNAPRRAESTVEPGAFSADAGKVVYPLDLTADESHIVTEVRDLTGNAVREVASVKYVSITGAVSDKPFEGMNIIVTRYTDGTTSTAKVMR